MYDGFQFFVWANQEVAGQSPRLSCSVLNKTGVQRCLSRLMFHLGVFDLLIRLEQNGTGLLKK